jgi:hypothetical protein
VVESSFRDVKGHTISLTITVVANVIIRICFIRNLAFNFEINKMSEMKTEGHLPVITRSNTLRHGNSHEQKGNDDVQPESHFALDFYGFVCKGLFCTRIFWK